MTGFSRANGEFRAAVSLILAEAGLAELEKTTLAHTIRLLGACFCSCFFSCSLSLVFAFGFGAHEAGFHRGEHSGSEEYFAPSHALCLSLFACVCVSPSAGAMADAAPPEDKSITTLWVGGLDEGVTEEELRCVSVPELFVFFCASASMHLVFGTYVFWCLVFCCLISVSVI